MKISPSDPLMIIAGIRQFGLAADGSDLRDLEAAVTRLENLFDPDWKCPHCRSNVKYVGRETTLMGRMDDRDPNWGIDIYLCERDHRLTSKRYRIDPFYEVGI